jgi:hypothetical protein
MNNRLIAGLVVLVGVLAGFYGGTKFGQLHSTASASTSAANAGTSASGQARTGASPGAGGGNGSGARTGAFGTPAAAGDIVAVGDGTITVHDRQSGKDVKINLGSARISKTVQGTAADLTQNQTVTVVGQKAADGTVNAQVISLGGGLGGGAGRPRPSPST